MVKTGTSLPRRMSETRGPFPGDNTVEREVVDADDHSFEALSEINGAETEVGRRGVGSDGSAAVLVVEDTQRLRESDDFNVRWAKVLALLSGTRVCEGGPNALRGL